MSIAAAVVDRGFFEERQSALAGLRRAPSRRAAGPLAPPEMPHAARGSEPSAQLARFPYAYAAIIHDLISQDRVQAARHLLQTALAQGTQDRELLALQRILAPPKVRRSSERSRDRRADIEWLLQNENLYRGNWVAVVGGEMVALSSSLHELLSQSQRIAPTERPLVQWIE